MMSCLSGRGYFKRVLFHGLCILQFLPFVACIHNSVPDPLPEQEWVGKSTLNYTELHEKYAETLVCMRIPLGTLGFFFWLTTILVTLATWLKTLGDVDVGGPLKQEPEAQKQHQASAQLQPRSRPGIVKAQACLTFGWCLFALVQNSRTLSECQTTDQFEVAKGTIISFLTADAFAMTAAVSLISWNWWRLPLIHGIACFFCYLSLFAHWITAGVGFNAVMDLHKPGGTGEVITEGVSAGQKIVVILVWSGVCLMSAWTGLKTGKSRGWWRGMFVAVMLLICAMFIGVYGLVFVFLGNVVGSPWGTYFVKQQLGELTASLIGVAGTAQVILAGFH